MKEKAKKWIKDNKEKIVIGALIVGGTAACVVGLNKCPKTNLVIKSPLTTTVKEPVETTEHERIVKEICETVRSVARCIMWM